LTAASTARAWSARGALAERKLDAILLFAPESHYYLCGYDTFGFAMFQCLVLTADGRLHLFTRAPDLRQARQTSTLDDEHIHIWVDFPMFYRGNPLPMNVGNVFFLHMILMDSDTGLAMCWGHSVLLTEQGVERLSRHSLNLVELD
jgi:Xaa-Pro dipeptidase